MLLLFLLGCPEEKIDTGTAPLPPWEIDADDDGATSDLDCDDADPGVFPGADEHCDGSDEDCDGTADEEAVDAAEWHADADGDGYGANEATPACDAPTGFIPDGSDCDDADVAVFPGAEESCDGADDDCDGEIDEGTPVGSPTWYPDADGDGFGDPEAGAPYCADVPPGWVSDATDCDDTDAGVSPEALEWCDGADQDCDGTPDDDPVDGTAWYDDRDADGFGDPASVVSACEAPAGRIADGADCDDTEAVVSPAGTETCDEVDQDCDGAVDEDAADATAWYADADGDGFGDGVATFACSAPAGFVAAEGDCDDTLSTVSPGADEHCDGVDEDCDGGADDSAVDAPTWYADVDGDGHGDPTSTQVTCDAPVGFAASDDDCDDTDAAVSPDGVEVCDDIDQDCDGTVDEDAVDAPTWFADADGDGFGNVAVSSVTCDAPTGYVADARDCDDGDAAVSPSADELCGGADEDCDGTVDEDSAADAPTWYADADGDLFGDPDVAAVSCLAPAAAVADATDCDDTDALVYPGRPETCDNGQDDDCDGDDDGCALLGEYAVEDVYQAVVQGGLDGYAGSDVAFAGDLDGDGADDLVLTVPGVDEAWLVQGVPYGDLDVLDVDDWLTGDVDDARVVGVGDTQGDGYADVVFGWGDASSPGVVRLYTGPWSGEKTFPEADVVVAGVGAERAGADVAGAGDVDGDGLDDWLVGAPLGIGDVADAGACYLLLGGASGTLSTADADASLPGRAARDYFGEVVVGAGDLDGDGLADVAVGAPSAFVGGVRSGAVYVFLDPLGSTDADATLAGLAAFDEAGSAVVAGDIDGDGDRELAVGAPYAGEVYLLWGPWSGDRSLDEGVTLGGRAADLAGSELAAGDFDHDGYDDLFVGAWRADRGGTDGGVVYGLPGPGAWDPDLADASLVVTGTAGGDLGRRMDVGDVDADGYADLFVGAAEDARNASNGGAAWLVTGQGI